MRILAIDPGSSCGWAVGDGKIVDASGVWQLAPRRGESPGMRYLHLRAKLNAVLAAFPDLRLVVYEQAHHRGGAATEYAVGYATHVQAWCAEHGITHGSVHSGSIKRFATGRGNADKVEMIEVGRRRFTPTTTTSDEIDALWILAWATASFSDRAVKE